MISQTYKLDLSYINDKHLYTCVHMNIHMYMHKHKYLLPIIFLQMINI